MYYESWIWRHRSILCGLKSIFPIDLHGIRDVWPPAKNMYTTITEEGAVSSRQTELTVVRTDRLMNIISDMFVIFSQKQTQTYTCREGEWKHDLWERRIIMINVVLMLRNLWNSGLLYSSWNPCRMSRWVALLWKVTCLEGWQQEQERKTGKLPSHMLDKAWKSVQMCEKTWCSALWGAQWRNRLENDLAFMPPNSK